MSTPDAKLGWQHGGLISLALLSLVVPMVAVFLRNEPLVPLADPARLSYYRQTIPALVLGLACALGSFAGARSVPPSAFRRLSIGLVSGGMLLSAYLLWTLIGNCGLQILWATCRP